MLADVIEVKTLKGYKLFIRFEDGKSGEVDIAEIIPFKGIFAQLKDKKYFDTVKIKLGTVCWENGADIAPCKLYSRINKNNN